MRNKLFLDQYKDEDIPLSEYPRPQFKRNSYFPLNGIWNITISKDEKIPEKIQDEIIVPFPLESYLSKQNRYLEKNEYIYYKKEFKLDPSFIKDHVILHFDGIDQVSYIYLNNHFIKENHGGYIPFEVDIKDYLIENNILIIKVKDNLDYTYPYGKQSLKSHGMWYTKTSGIWKSVWIESYSKNYFKNVKITPSLNSVTFELNTNIKRKSIIIKTKDKEIKKDFSSNKVTIDIPSPHLWSPEDPYLYNFTLFSNDDVIESYFALRTLEIKDVDGRKRILLNGKPYFFHGILDQGYYPDGLLTPKSYKVYQDEIRTLKKLGFNTLRKHIKIEPLYFYYLCDKEGIIVFQDFVNNSKYSFFKETLLPTIGIQKLKNYGRKRNIINKKIFIQEANKTISLLYNSPSICYYTIFNEGWGQFDASKIYEYIKTLDSTRIIDTTSGWFTSSSSDVDSKHIYFKKIRLKKSNKPIIVSEFGGYVYKIKEHSYNLDKTFGYKIFKDQTKFQKALFSLYKKEIIPYIKKGLCGSIITQLSDVEDETNGLITYDRKIIKVDIDKMKEISDEIKNSI